MKRCQVAVLGLGLMGSAALHSLRQCGVDALGFDPIEVGTPRGSSHGSCRVYRRFNFENPAYTALSDQAYAGWRGLEIESGRTILMPSPVLEAGPAGSTMVRQSHAAAGAAGVSGRLLSGAEANAAYPAFNLPDDWEVALQDSGGILLAEAALRALRGRTLDWIVPETARFEASSAGLRVITASQEVMAQQVIVATGPWIGDLIPDLKPHLAVTRQTVGWFEPAQPERVALGAFPIFLLEAPQGIVYGFPNFEGRGVKAARHDHGRMATPDDWEVMPTDEELAGVSTTLREFIPGAAGPIAGRDVCLYTNTRPADVRADSGEEFIMDRLPQDPRIIVASPCSGHGAKFATAIGAILARLATDAGYQTDPAFRLDRFSTFAGRTRGPGVAPAAGAGLLA